MVKYGGYMGKYLDVDLTSGTVSLLPLTDSDCEKFLGGKIVASAIIARTLGERITDVDPFAPENVLVISTGPLTGTGAPSSARFNVSTISPLTGLVASSNCGGSFGFHLKRAGYDGLVIRGKATSPVYIEIEGDAVKIKHAAEMWGKLTSETQSLLGNGGKMVIGPAGENLVRYASIVSGERIAGRCGVGAVMGSKNLKAVVARGDKTIPVSDRQKASRVFKEWVELLRSHPLTGSQLPKLGTAGLVAPMNMHNILATKNFRFGRFENFELVSGEFMYEKYLVKNRGCLSCPIQCGRVVKFGEKEIKGPELETLGLLGPNLLNSDLESVIHLNYLMDEFGMDTISAGGTIAFAMELNEKGIWKNGLRFGAVQELPDLVRDIAYRRGIGDNLAEGSRRLAAKFGGEEFAINSKGLELAAYQPQGAFGMGLGYATANRGGCHLNAGYLVILEGLALEMDPFTPKSKAAYTVLFQDMMEAVSAAGSCLFTLYTMIPELLLRNANSWITRTANKNLAHLGGLVSLLLRMPASLVPIHLKDLPHTRALSAVTGMNITFGRLREIGARGFNLERYLNAARGAGAADDSLPKRLLSSHDGMPGIPLEIMKKEYYALRGWGKDGVPSRRRFGLDELRLPEKVPGGDRG